MNDQKLYILKKSYRILRKQTLFELLNIGRFDHEWYRVFPSLGGTSGIVAGGAGDGGRTGTRLVLASHQNKDILSEMKCIANFFFNSQTLLYVSKGRYTYIIHFPQFSHYQFGFTIMNKQVLFEMKRKCSNLWVLNFKIKITVQVFIKSERFRLWNIFASFSFIYFVHKWSQLIWS